MTRIVKFGRNASVPATRRRSRMGKPECVRLEDITLLSAYLYVDYGDNFAGGVLQGADVTVGNLYSHTASGGADIHGPRLSDNQNNDFADGTSLVLTSFSTFYTGLGTLTPAQIVQMRATIDAMVQRVYEPYDVTVIDLSAAGTTVNGHLVTAAASFDDVSRTLAASGGHDSYVFVAQAIIGGTVADPTTDPTQFPQNGYGGIASALDIGGNNDHIGTALALLKSTYQENKVGQTVAHEAGHLFGLAHAWRSDKGDDPDPRASVPTKDQLDLYHDFDTMSYLAFSGVSAFSRVPTTADKVLDGGNWVPNLDPNVLNTTPNPYEHFKADPNVGASQVEYVTGTGAHDVITIAKTGATTALVTVQPFFDTAYTNAITVPSQATATYSYSIDTTKPIIIDGGAGNDRFVIDGDLGTTITVRGDTWSNDPSGKADTLIVLGKGAAGGVFVPGTNDQKSLAGGSEDLRGQITIGSTVISFLEFTHDSGVTVSDVQDFVYQTPPVPAGGSGGDDLTINSPAAGQNRISGSTSGVTVVPLTFFNITNFTIDSRTNHVGGLYGDSYTINNPDGPALVASGLRDFTIQSSAGNDVLTVNANDFRLPVAGGEFLFDAGTGHYGPPGNSPASNLRGLISFDRIVVNADVDYQIRDVGTLAADRTPPEGLLSIAAAGSGQASSALLGSIRLIGVEAGSLTGGASNNRIDGSGFSGALVLAGLDGDDTLIGGSGDNDLYAGGGNDLMIVGPDVFANPGLGSQNQVVLRGGGHNVLHGGTGSNTFLVNLNGTAELIGGTGANLFIVNNPAVGVRDPVGGLTVQGGGTPNDVLRIVGGGGAGYNQAYLLGPEAGEGAIVTTNNFVTDGPTISQFIRYSGISVIDDSSAVDKFMVVPNSTTAAIGGVSGDDLASGTIHPTVGGFAFGEIRFSNKLDPTVLPEANGQLIRPTPPLPMMLPAMLPAAGPAPIAVSAPASPTVVPTTTAIVAAPTSATPPVTTQPVVVQTPTKRPARPRHAKHQTPRRPPVRHRKPVAKHSTTPKGPMALLHRA